MLCGAPLPGGRQGGGRMRICRLALREPGYRPEAGAIRRGPGTRRGLRLDLLPLDAGGELLRAKGRLPARRPRGPAAVTPRTVRAQRPQVASVEEEALIYFFSIR